MMKTVCVIGAGQLGSRHLQALKAVKENLKIIVIDPNEQCLNTAKERYSLFDVRGGEHVVKYLKEIPIFEETVSVAIVASNSDVRRRIVEELLKNATVEYMVLEKLLFQKKEDYFFVRDLLAARKVKTWVNCSMRTIPIYNKIKHFIKDKKIFYHVSGGSLGLATCAIHYLDHITFLTDESEYSIDTSALSQTVFPSKRKGFLEINGSLNVSFANGSQGVLTSYSQGEAPVVVQIFTSDARIIIRETEGKYWLSTAQNSWKWEQFDETIPFQSEMTTNVVESILATGECPLVDFETSMKTHLCLLEELLSFVNNYSNDKYDYYPFT